VLRTALVTGADRGLGRGLTQALLRDGWTVLAGKHLEWPELDHLAQEFPHNLHILDLDVSADESVRLAAARAGELVPHLDLLIGNAAINRSAHIDSIREPQSFDDMLCELNVNAIGALRVVQAFLPLLDQGNLKRLCFVSSEAGSIGASRRTGWFGYCMSKAALNMAVKNLANDLAPHGYSFRLYHPGWLRTYMRGTKNLEAHMEPEEAAGHALRYFLNDNVSPELVLHDWEGKDYPW
jgi:NAD(P)-dependent dehydrogenase (short-subunit alcohol dehydrogenase family)